MSNHGLFLCCFFFGCKLWLHLLGWTLFKGGPVWSAWRSTLGPLSWDLKLRHRFPRCHKHELPNNKFPSNHVVNLFSLFILWPIFSIRDHSPGAFIMSSLPDQAIWEDLYAEKRKMLERQDCTDISVIYSAAKFDSALQSLCRQYFKKGRPYSNTRILESRRNPRRYAALQPNGTWIQKESNWSPPD